MIKQVTRQDLRTMHHNIFTAIINYLLGPKCDCRFRVEYANSKFAWNVIHIQSSYFLPDCTLYFGDSLRIRIYEHQLRDWDNYYIYFDGRIKGIIDFDMDVYMYITKTFLYELIRHINSIHPYPEYYPMMHRNTDGYVDGGAVKGFDNPPDYFSEYCNTHEGLLLYQYTYDDVALLQYVISCMKSKAFRRSRGDYHT